MIRLPPRSTRTDTPFPYTTLFRSLPAFQRPHHGIGDGRQDSLPACLQDELAKHDQQNLVRRPARRSIEGERIEDQAVETLPNNGRTNRAGPEIFAIRPDFHPRSEEHTSELQSLMRISYAVFFL